LTDPAKVHSVAGKAKSGANGDGERRLPDPLLTRSWPDPLPLPPGLPPVLPFDFDLLPQTLRAWIRDISERMQCPPDYCAATAMIMAGTLIGRKVAIRPKALDDWQVPPNLYGAMVGRPSLMKSPAMKEALKFLCSLEVRAKADFDKATSEHKAAAIIAEATTKVQKEAIKRALKDGRDAHKIALQIVSEETRDPLRRRYMCNDTTVEKLGVILAENPNGILIFLDELISLLRTMERDGHEGDRGFYLTAWAGDSRYTYDRIGRGTLDIEAAIVSIVGSIQPGVLDEYLRYAVSGGFGDDGLMQRFQMTVWPDAPMTWKNIDRCPDASAKAAAYKALQRLANLAPADVEAESDDDNHDALPFLHFDPDAQSLFDNWRAVLEARLLTGEEHPAVESHLAKYRSLIPSLALIGHILDGGVGPVGITSLQKAIGWGRYLESHARRLYASVTDAPAVAARLLAVHIQKGQVPDHFAARDVYRKCWAGLDRKRTEAAIDVLLSLHWLEERIEYTAGKPRTRYAINPKIKIPLEPNRQS
jgi:putative DNA primase/helicase